MFGLGELSTGEGGQYSGLGGAGIALQSYNFLNTANPASLTAIEGQRFLIDAGVMGAYKVYTQTGTSNHSLVGNLNNLSIGCRITPRWYGAVFMAPVSSVGYAITLDQDITGTGSSTVSSLFEGEGGLSKMGISTAYRLFKGFSVGANLSYVTGTIKQTETQGSINVEESSYKHAFYADFGLQYKFSLNRNKYLVAGAVYGYSQDLAQDNTLSVSSTSGNESIDESQSHVRQCLPQFVGAGLAYNSPRWTLTAEYKYTDWSRMKSSQSNVRFENQHRLSAGTAYTAGNIYRNPVKLLLGAGVSNSYIVIQKKKATNYYVSAGSNFTLYNGNVLSLGVKYSDQLHLPNGMQRERGVTLFFNFTFSERTYRAKIQ
ncbi:hypothetical protein M085_4373 [Bacteroides fragilis str. 3986 N(B)19]|jgi:hypothetical protein|nr:hypothetical protein M085_4373 [Bacteroides fragilis str. 3986 N(B)19]